ncbi:uncharacterized protein LOC105388511 isoform X1 [Plutella xylostella]|uniref:uncharacterized protein LOC105388511 isoform X1 n=1 Tax=Plutella xylostella TaxID=51655 RepID=UPI002032F543|nr:uncharacterized protein LOC105388511 isoform X1 [Plutella xylostella]
MATMVKRSSNYSKETDDINDNQPSLVTVRISRAWTGSPGDDMTVTSQDGGSFLSLPLAAPLRAQVDLEARADGNQLVYVGKSGRISMAVSDARRAHSSVTLRATNTGLAAARFTAIAKDCSPELPSLLQRSLGSDVVTSGSQLIPPRHTRRYTLVLPGELPAGVTRCKVCLLNHKNESVAIREVALKKGDRCFCVWHCDCVCLTDDPKLLCRALPAPLLSAGGVPHARPRPRKREPPCEAGQPGCLVAMMGAVVAVLGLGLLKGIIGIFIRKVAYYKLDVVCSMPRPLHKYQEPWLRSRPVSLDAAGYAVHPDTGLRTVHSMPILSMLMMNTILIPAIAFHYLDKCIRYCVQPQGKAGSLMLQPAYNTMDMQVSNTSSLESKKRRRPRCVQRWMSPPAEQLSAELWTKALDPHIDSMGPQLMESFGRQYDVAQSSVDSMVEDPEPGRSDSVIVSKQQESALNDPAEDDEVAEGRASETQTCLPMRPSATGKERRWRRRAPQDPLCIIS